MERCVKRALASKKKHWVLGAFAAIATSVAAAEQPVGPYFGFLAGTTEVSVGARVEDPESGGTALVGWSGDRLTWGAFAGWQVTPHIGAELGFLGMRKFGDRWTDEEDGIDYSETIKLTNLNASAIGTLPIGKTWSIYGRVGAARTQARYRYRESTEAFGGDVSYTESEKGKETNLFYGVGVGAVFENARVRLEYTKFKYDDINLADELDIEDDDVVVKTKVNMLSLSVVWFLPFGK